MKEYQLDNFPKCLHPEGCENFALNCAQVGLRAQGFDIVIKLYHFRIYKSLVDDNK